MKNKIFFAVCFIHICLLPFAFLQAQQVPQAFNYQSVVRGADGTPLVNKNITVRASIREGSSAGAIVYQETHSAITNQFGLINLAIGTGRISSAHRTSANSPLHTFATIPWGKASMWMQIEADFGKGMGYEPMGTSQLLSVPYAIYSGNVVNQFPTRDSTVVSVDTSKTGPDGINCWDLNGNRFNDANEDKNADGIFSALDCQAACTTSCANGINCWDLNGDRMNDPNEDINHDGFWNAEDCTGAMGLPGAMGPQGPQGILGSIGATGAIGLSGAKGNIGAVGPMGAVGIQGQKGASGLAGKDGKNGINCWDVNGNGKNDTIEDTNHDAVWNAKDCADNETTAWLLKGNAGTDDKIDFIGTTDDRPLNFRIKNENAGYLMRGNVFFGYKSSNIGKHANTAMGSFSLNSATTSDSNALVGFGACRYSDQMYNSVAIGVKAKYDCSGDADVVIGTHALYSCHGQVNIAIGSYASNKQAQAYENVAIGASALKGCGGDIQNKYNTAVGCQSLFNNKDGRENTAVGMGALFYNTDGTNNTAIGYLALYFNEKIGMRNIGMGREVLFHNTNNSASYGFGVKALYWSNEGWNNAGIGTGALYSNTKGKYNCALGHEGLGANQDGEHNIALGCSALFQNVDGNHNVGLGDHAGTNEGDLEFSTAIGSGSINTADNQIRIGNDKVTSIGGQVEWTTLSDGRFKKDIQETVPGLAFITKLRPVTYHINIDAQRDFLKVPDSLSQRDSEVRKTEMLQTGFIAQEVEKVANEIGFDFNGVDKPKNENDYYGLRYAAFTVPLVKAVQEQQEMIEEEQNSLTAQQMELADFKLQVANVLSINADQEFRLDQLEKAIRRNVITVK